MYSGLYILTIFLDFYSLPQKVISDNVLQQLKNHENYRSEYMILREFFLGIGWLTSFGALFFLDGITNEKLKYLFIIMIILTLISTYKLAQINLDEK